MPMTMTERLDHARAALTAYFQAKGEPPPRGPWDYEDTAASDLIADLLHLQKALGLRGTDETMKTAVLHFEAEEKDALFSPCRQCASISATSVAPLPWQLLAGEIADARGVFVASVEGEVPSGYEAEIARTIVDCVNHSMKHPHLMRPSGPAILEGATEAGSAIIVPLKTITVHVEGGLVQDVTGIPTGYELRVEDYDTNDTSHPSWDVEKECSVTIYDGGAE